MTGLQKDKIRKLRIVGKGYAHIAAELGISTNNVKVFCSRNALTDKDIEALRNNESDGCCPYCHKTIEQRNKSKPRRFCSDECRLAWWKEHPECKRKKALYTIICAECGKEFISYGNANRKYCREAEKNYRLSMYIFKKMLTDGVITNSEYKKIDTIIAKKYDAYSCSLL